MVAGFASLVRRLVVPPEIRGGRLSAAVTFLSGLTDNTPQADRVCDSPIFLLSAGWRSGSTLLQRLICSDQHTLIWGEPFEDRLPIPRLAAAIQEFGADDPHLKWSIDKFDGSLTDDWIGNLNPGFGALRDAHVAYLESLFAEPAAAHHFRRWGVKFVRLTAQHAVYLKWLYPQAKFVFLVRHPLTAYQSYKGKRWYSVHPTARVDGVVKFMGHWGYLVESFLSERQRVGAILVRYEDLTARAETIEEIAAHLGVSIRKEVLDKKVGSRTRQDLPVNGWDRGVCRLLTGDLCCALGYQDS